MFPIWKAAQARVSACERKIGRLAASLALAEDSAASKYIIAEMERLDVELGALKREASLAEMESHRAAASAKDAKATAAEIAKLIHGLDGFDDKEKRDRSRCNSGVFGTGSGFLLSSKPHQWWDLPAIVNIK